MASSSSSEIEAYDESIRARLSLIRDAVCDLATGELNRRPAATANSPWVLATHTVGNARAWIIGIALGESRRRDRPGEFASQGDSGAELAAAIDEAMGEMSAALRSLDPARLDHRIVPAQELWGEGPPHEISVRDAIIQVIEHASLHLGHLQVTLQWNAGAR